MEMFMVGASFALLDGPEPPPAKACGRPGAPISVAVPRSRAPDHMQGTRAGQAKHRRASIVY
jgi:hypothetical protein